MTVATLSNRQLLDEAVCKMQELRFRTIADNHAAILRRYLETIFVLAVHSRQLLRDLEEGKIVFPYAMKDGRSFTGTVQEGAEGHPAKALPFIVETDDRTIEIGFEGYGEAGAAIGYGRPINIEFYEGKLILRVWADTNSEDPTHVIDLSGAQESLYKDPRDKPKRCPNCNGPAMCEGPVSMESDYYCPDCNTHFSEEEAVSGEADK